MAAIEVPRSADRFSPYSDGRSHRMAAGPFRISTPPKPLPLAWPWL